MPTLFLVELFSGTGSFSSAAEEEASNNGYSFKKISVDIHPKYNPSTCIDIRGWNYKQAVGDFLRDGLGPSDVLWVHASPPCNEYSRAKTCHPRDLPFADSLVQQALRIITYCAPDFWTIENPVGLMHQRPFMQHLAAFKHQTSYCQWGRPFRKHTHIWSNVPLALPVCCKGSYCMERALIGRHSVSAQTRDFVTGTGNVRRRQNVNELYALPPGLVKHIVRSALSLLEAKVNHDGLLKAPRPARHVHTTMCVVVAALLQLLLFRRLPRTKEDRGTEQVHAR